MSEPITLVQAIAFCCEKNEVMGGWGHRFCPFESEEAARATFAAWVEELTRWKGAPQSIADIEGTRRAVWADIRIKQRGLGIGLWIRVGDVFDVWVSEIWKRRPCNGVFTWED